ncbi:DUF7305 domain-containing protein [Sporosarcina aquimarina]|uniref:Type 4 fimbrial biogenesis protein PilX N-terminal domain-containing protein n=1 Tax=Sporosarcina aquimarina TaxID=114975 RepID=A0ABU4FY62_9BACL|nr:PilX N-terminal domain-containing pilus assembly protein [Sporosarcina aquimarina]MDW0109650.1 hypothetical protein [Sporosarcina aquimarina]
MKKQNEDGYTLIVVLMVLLVFSVLTASILGLTVRHHTSGLQESNDKSAFYIAEAGLNYAVKDIEKIAKEELVKFAPTEKLSVAEQKERYLYAVKNAVKDNPVYPYKFNAQNNSKPIVAITILKNEEKNKLKVISTGKISSKTRKLTQYVTLKYAYLNEGEKPGKDEELPPIKNPDLKYPDNTAVFVNNKISLTGGASIHGNIGTNLEQSNSITFSGGSKLTGSIYVPAGFENKALNKEHYLDIGYPLGLPGKVNFNLPEFPSYPSLVKMNDLEIGPNEYNRKKVIMNGSLFIDNWITDNYTLRLDKNYSFNQFIVDQDNDLNIDMGNEDRILVVDDLKIINGKINFVGKGNLTIMVKKTITMGSGSVINTSKDTKRLKIYLDNDKITPNNLEVTGAQKIYGSLFAKNTNITITGGGGFQGNIITGGKKVVISGGGSALSTLLLAPNADVTLNGGGKVNGVILGKSLTMDGGTAVNFGEFDINPDEFFPPPEKEQPVYKPIFSEVIKIDKVIEE